MMAPLEVVQHFQILALMVRLGNYLLTTTKWMPELQPPCALTYHRKTFQDNKKRSVVFAQYQGKIVLKKCY